MLVVLSGGLGGARFLRGLCRVLPAEQVTIVGNTGDDIRVYGVHVSPDLDIVTFGLAGVLDDDRQYGIRGDTSVLMDGLREAGHDPWFSLGDRDFAHCLARTLWLDQGVPLHEATARLTRRYAVAATLLPMTDDPVYTVVDTPEGPLHFQEYWVRRRGRVRATGVRLEGGQNARPAPGVVDAIRRADAVLIAPSNPVVSIGTILAVPGIDEALRATAAPVVAVSPIVGGRVVRGMADRLLPLRGAEVSARGVARLYAGLLSGFVLDVKDQDQAQDVECETEVTNTMMHTIEDAAALAKATLALAERLA